VNESFKKFVSDESGVTAVEYGMFVALVSCIIIGVMGSVGTHLKTTFSTVASSL
jgi:pilus assembly protein Flp/PilA